MKQNKTVASTLTKRRSVYWLSQNLEDGEGNALIDMPALHSALQNLPDGTFWALIKHDKDPADDNPALIKPAHVHIFIRLKDNNCTIQQMSKTLGIRAEQFVLPEKIRHNNYRVKGLDVDAHCVQYMTHQHADTKAPYDSALIMTNDKQHLDYLLAIEIVPPAAREEVARALIETIVQNKRSLLDYCSSSEFDPVLFIDKYQKLQNAEKTRVKLHPHNVQNRKVIFISGYKSGCGKTSLAVKLAEEIAIRQYNAPEDVNARAQQPYVFVMSPETGWNNYTSQPILILDDIKPSELKKALGSASAVKTVLDPHPLSIAYNVKNSIVVPSCEYVLINSIYGYSEYIDILGRAVFTDEPVTQYMRRIAAQIYIANDDLLGYKTSASGYYSRHYELPAVYCPVLPLISRDDRTLWHTALKPIVDDLTRVVETKIDESIDVSRLGLCPIEVTE